MLHPHGAGVSAGGGEAVSQEAARRESPRQVSPPCHAPRTLQCVLLAHVHMNVHTCIVAHGTCMCAFMLAIIHGVLVCVCLVPVPSGVGLSPVYLQIPRKYRNF